MELAEHPLESQPNAAAPRGGVRWLGAFGKGLAWMLIVVWVAVTITFTLSRIVPADPARMVAGLEADAEAVAQVRENLGLDDPLPVQYVNYLSDLARLDFGDSLRTQRPLLPDLLEALPASLELIVVSFTMVTVIGIVLGIAWAYWPKGVHTLFLRLVAVSGSAIPVFWVGLIFQIIFGKQLGWLPVAGNFNHAAHGVSDVTGAGTVDTIIALDPGAFANAVKVLILPVSTIVVHQLALTMALMRSSLEEQLKKPYVRAARARGVSEPRIVLVDAVRNALNPVVTMLGLQLGWSFGGIIIVEVIFSWPGVGLYSFNAFQAFDYNVIMAITILSTASFVLINAAVGVLYGVLDPRIKENAS